MTPPMPASTKVETWIFIRRVRGTNDEGGEGLLNDASKEWRCVLRRQHRRQWPKSLQGFHPELTKPKDVVASPPHLPKPCKPCNTPPPTTTAEDCATAPHAMKLPAKRTSRSIADREKARTPGAAAPASSSPAGRPSPETQTGRDLPQVVRGATPTNRHRARRLGSHDLPRSQGRRPDQPASALETPVALA
jgi:hypothetical protein